MSPQHHIGQTVDAAKFAEQLDTSEELILPESGNVRIATKHSEYEFDIGAQLGRGGVIGPEWQKARIHGTTFGGSMIAMGRLIRGALLEFILYDGSPFGKVYTTSPMEWFLLDGALRTD